MLSRASRLVLTGAFLKSHQSGAFTPLWMRGISASATPFKSRRPAAVDVEYDNNHDSLLLTNDPIVHLNHAGASPSPECVLDTVIQHLELEQRLGGYKAAELKQNDLVQVYQDVASLVHASSPNEIALVESATVAWTRIFYSMVEHQDTSRTHHGKRVILTSEAEYAANVVGSSQWARTHDDWTVLPLPSSTNISEGGSTGVVDLNVFQSMLGGSHKLVDPNDIALVCVTHIPTNSGIVNPVEQIGRLIEEYNKSKNARDESQILFLVDACQSVGQMDVNVQEIKCHGLAATGRKFLRAPRGTGFLYVRDDIVDLLTPSHLDLASAPITRVPSTYPPPNIEDWIDITLQPGAKRFEFWESNVAGKLGLGQAAQYAMNEVGLDHISSCCRLVAVELVALLNEMNGIDLHHESSCGIVTFTVRGLDSATVKDLLWMKQPGDDCRFEVSVVPATSTPLDSARCQVPDLVRASVSYTTSLQDIKRFATRLQTIIKDQQ